MTGAVNDLGDRHVLGVDGGNTKTIALVVDRQGSVRGAALGACTDVYGAETPLAALAELERVVRDACGQADTSPERIATSVFSLAGADWPEDYEFLKSELAARLGTSRQLVMNDALGPLHIGTDDGVGVSLVCGTYLAVGARAPSGRTWHSSFWAEPGGAHGLGSMALRTLYRAHLGLEPPTSITGRLLELYDAPSPEEVLHWFTRRSDPAPTEAHFAEAGRVLLDEAAAGDRVAQRLLERHAALLREYATAAARQVRLPSASTVVLAGGVFGHQAHVLEDLVKGEFRKVEPKTRVVRADLPPVAGAVLHGLRSLPDSPSTDTRRQLARSINALGLEARPASGVSFNVARYRA